MLAVSGCLHRLNWTKRGGSTLSSCFAKPSGWVLPPLVKATADTFQPGMPSFGYALERRHQSRKSWRGSIPHHPFFRMNYEEPNRLEGCCDSLT